jgi:hypothetical protein
MLNRIQFRFILCFFSTLGSLLLVMLAPIWGLAVGIMGSTMLRDHYKIPVTATWREYVAGLEKFKASKM